MKLAAVNIVTAVPRAGAPDAAVGAGVPVAHPDKRGGAIPSAIATTSAIRCDRGREAIIWREFTSETRKITLLGFFARLGYRPTRSIARTISRLSTAARTFWKVERIQPPATRSPAIEFAGHRNDKLQKPSTP